MTGCSYQSTGTPSSFNDSLLVQRSPESARQCDATETGHHTFTA
jgi:hypothetical protein